MYWSSPITQLVSPHGAGAWGQVLVCKSAENVAGVDFTLIGVSAGEYPAIATTTSRVTIEASIISFFILFWILFFITISFIGNMTKAMCCSPCSQSYLPSVICRSKCSCALAFASSWSVVVSDKSHQLQVIRYVSANSRLSSIQSTRTVGITGFSVLISLSYNGSRSQRLHRSSPLLLSP